MRTETILLLCLFGAGIIAVTSFAVSQHLTLKSHYGEGMPTFVKWGYAIVSLHALVGAAAIVQMDLATIPIGTYPVADTVLEYSPGSIDPTDVTVNGKTASVDAIQVDTSLKEPLVVVKEDRVTVIVPSRDYFASQANR